MNLKFPEIRALARLPYFTAGAEGGMRIRPGLFEYPVYDMHTHLGWNFLFARSIPLWKKTGPPKHFFPETGNPVDLSRYTAFDYTPENARIARLETVRGVINSRGHSSTHTIPNILAEMDRMGIAKACVLAIDLPAVSRNSEHIISSINKHAESRARLIPFMSLHPHMLRRRARFARNLKHGARGIKLHPQMQLFRPTHRRTELIYQLAESHDIPILFHTGLSPISPRFQKRYVEFSLLERVVEAHPNLTVILGHAGILDWERAIALADHAPRVYLELSGQSVPVIAEILKRVDPERILFGSDWPYFPIALPLAKVLLATEGNAVMRRRVFSENARRLLREE